MIDRELLETTALAEVCACQYYDLEDTLQEATDEELQGIIDHTTKCDICGE